MADLSLGYTKSIAVLRRARCIDPIGSILARALYAYYALDMDPGHPKPPNLTSGECQRPEDPFSTLGRASHML